LLAASDRSRVKSEKWWNESDSKPATSRAAERYEPFPRVVLERAIVDDWPARRWKVYAALRLESGGPWRARVRTERLATLTGLDPGNVRRELAALQRSGMARRQRKSNGPGRWEFAGVDYDTPAPETKRVAGDAFPDPQNASLATRPPLSDKQIPDRSLPPRLVRDPATANDGGNGSEWTDRLVASIRQSWRRAGEGPDYSPERIRRALDEQASKAREAGLRAPTPGELNEYHRRRSIDASVFVGARSPIAVATAAHRWIEWLRKRIEFQARRTG
jgi:hypothetical protein